MLFFNNQRSHLKSALLVVLAITTSACVRPKNQDSNIDSAATFYVGEVKASMDMAELIPGTTLPAARLYTFTACLKDRRTDESLPGAPVRISGGLSDQDIHTDKTGCAIWSEKISFDVLSDQKYLPISRKITATGAQSGVRALRLAINPWSIGDKTESSVDLDYHSLPASLLASDEQVQASLRADGLGQKPRKLFIAKLPFENSPLPTIDGRNVRRLKIELDPSVALTDVYGTLVTVPVGFDSGKLQATAALIESVTSGGQETSTVVSRTKDVKVLNHNGSLSADLELPVLQGTQGSRYSLALKLAIIDGPKGLEAFEGLFTIGDVHQITEQGASSAALKSSNRDATFAFDAALMSAKPLVTQTLTPITNTGSGAQMKTFSMSIPTPRWLGRIESSANRRTVLYAVEVCMADLSNGGRPADNTEFSIQKSDGSWIVKTASVLDGVHGCFTWEDSINHLYYEPERWFTVPVTIKHKSGYSETREYAVDPWQYFRFNADPGTTPEFIKSVNRQAVSNPSYLIADNVEVNTQGNAYYQVDDYLSLKYVKTLGLKIPMRVARPSNYLDSVNVPEPLRPGRYLLKAAYVSPVSGVVDRTPHLLIAPMLGLAKVVEAKGGFIVANIDIPVTDLRLFAARSYLVFEVYLLDDALVPQDNPNLLNVPDPMMFVDRKSSLLMPTFATVLNFKSEKDSSGVIWNTADLSALNATTDAVNGIASKRQISEGLRTVVQPLASQSVDRLDAKAANDLKTYRGLMERERSIGRIAGRSNADFVFIQNEQYNSTNDQILQSNNLILPPPSHAVDALLKSLNTPLERMGSRSARSLFGAHTDLTRDSLLAAVSGAKGMDMALATQLCGYFFYTQPRTKVNGFAWSQVEFGSSGAWTDLCIAQLKDHGADGVFSIDHRLRVLETNGVSFVRGRDDLQIKTGTQIGFAQVHTTTNGWSTNFGTGGITSELALAFGGSVMRVLNAGLGGVGVAISHADSNSNVAQDGFSFEAGHGLSIEQTEININVTKSDECIVVRPRPLMFGGLKGSAHMKILKLKVGDQPAEKLMNRGLMLCAGIAKTQARSVPERYYTLASLNMGGLQTDVMDVRNLPWLMQLRGQRDFASFLMMARAKKTSQSDPNQAIEIGDLPNAYLQNAYDSYFAGKMSTMPGTITLEPKIILRSQVR